MSNALLREAQLFLQNGNYQQAEAFCTLLTVVSPADGAAWMGVGIARFCQGYIERAKEAFEIALHIQRESLSPLLWKIECLLKLEEKEQAVHLFTHIHKETKCEYEREHIRQLETILGA